jgi:hypothetical protein
MGKEEVAAAYRRVKHLPAAHSPWAIEASTEGLL